MHQQPAGGVGAHAALPVIAAVAFVGPADPVGTLALEGELGRVLEDEDGAMGSDDAAARRLDVARQDIPLADPVVDEEPLGRLGVGPVLARQGKALSHGGRSLRGLTWISSPPIPPDLQPAERLWRLTNEPRANQHFDTLADLNHVLADHCCALADNPDRIRAETLFRWWPPPPEMPSWEVIRRRRYHRERCHRPNRQAAWRKEGQ